MSRHVWLAQCLCPSRHAILATAGEAEDYGDAQRTILDPLRTGVSDMLASRTIDPWCGLCKAPSAGWTYEVRRSRFRTMEEAAPALQQIEAEQAVTRQVWGSTPTEKWH